MIFIFDQLGPNLLQLRVVPVDWIIASILAVNLCYGVNLLAVSHLLKFTLLLLVFDVLYPTLDGFIHGFSNAGVHSMQLL